jgi:hypothetical protein
MASSEAARKAWETRRAKLAAEGKAPSQSPKKASTKPARRGTLATLVRQQHIRPAGEQVYLDPAKAPTGPLVQGFRIDTREYEKRHHKSPEGHGRWTIVISGRHARYGCTAKKVEGPIECSWDELLEQIPRLATLASIAAGVVRIMP